MTSEPLADSVVVAETLPVEEATDELEVGSSSSVQLSSSSEAVEEAVEEAIDEAVDEAADEMVDEDLLDVAEEVVATETLLEVVAEEIKLEELDVLALLEVLDTAEEVDVWVSWSW